MLRKNKASFLLRNNSISIFFPCYNDSKTIGKLVKKAYEILPTLCKNYEVTVIDDCSRDNSRNILTKLKKRFKDLRLIFHSKNQGYGGALRSGFESSSKKLIFYTDGDGQYDVGELKILYTLMTEDVDFVNGIKMVRKDPTYRIFIGNLYSFLARWIFFLPTYDVDCDFRLIRKAIINKTTLKSSSGAICVELVKKSQLAGAKFRQVSVHHYERRWGSSQFFKPSRLLLTLKELAFLLFELMIYDRLFKYHAKK